MSNASSALIHAEALGGQAPSPAAAVGGADGCPGPQGRIAARARAVDVAERFGPALEYLEAHLARVVRLETLARHAGLSPWHFARVFQAAFGIPPLEYHRRRRLSRAAAALAAGQSVVQVALEWGYGSQQAFTRAFTRAFGVSPGTYRRQGVRDDTAALRLMLPLCLPGPIAPPTLRYVERAPSRWVGLCMPALGRPGALPEGAPTLLEDRPRPAAWRVSSFWEDWMRNGRWRAVRGIDPDDRGHGLSRVRAGGDLDYFIAVEVPLGAPAPEGFQVIQVPGGRYAVFAANGEPARTMPALVFGAFGRWLPDASARLRPGAWSFERFVGSPALPAPRVRCELWVAVSARRSSPE